MMPVREGFPTPNAWTTLSVTYGETDAMGVVYYANYLHWFEKARNTLIHAHGMSYRDVEARGIMMPVREASCRYVRPARFDDEVHILIGIEKWGRASVNFLYEVYRQDDVATLLVTGTTQHAFVSTAGKPTAVPPWFKELFS